MCLASVQATRERKRMRAHASLLPLPRSKRYKMLYRRVVYGH